ncbi:DUF998 domain-containing protein [Nonomuraea africana]|uniref:Membrane protein n=1 Tax=Nonomuraea africana TaxID=46171 RepID=A0ABR9KCG7_9ACTN|nr:DUF998 domain-containing protein [Nonomuraea africana]MBE1559496.1 putative membrane protein [Nonomuraea africana]
MTTFFLVCGAVSGPLFILTFLVAGTVRRSYSQLRHPVSSLALGEHGWVQTVNFIVTGLLTVAFAVGLRQALDSVLVPVLIGLHGLGLVGAGLFVTDPISGYPPGTPDRLEKHTRNGALHDLVSVPTFVAWPISAIVLGVDLLHRSQPGWGIYSVATGVAFFAMFAVSSVGFAQVPSLVGLGGLFQRITVAIGFTWTTLLAVHLMG